MVDSFMIVQVTSSFPHVLAGSVLTEKQLAGQAGSNGGH